jgi:hypothetical protein
MGWIAVGGLVLLIAIVLVGLILALDRVRNIE